MPLNKLPAYEGTAAASPREGPRDTPRPIVVALGDTSFHHASRYQPPTPNKRIVRMLEERYCVIRVDEHNTSKLCCHCPKELTDIKAVRGERRQVVLRGIRQCKTGINLITLDRDYSAATNIMALITHGGERLAVFRKEDDDDDGAAPAAAATSDGSSGGSSSSSRR